MSLIETARSFLLLPSKDGGGGRVGLKLSRMVVLRVVLTVGSYGVFHLIRQSDFWQTWVEKFHGILISSVQNVGVPMIQSGLIPDFIIRFGIRLQLRAHLIELRSPSIVKQHEMKMSIINELRNMPIAIQTDEANKQHYEVPSTFYDLCLGPCKKYSSGYWPSTLTSLEESEIAMLDLYCERAQLEDGMSMADLGCGWGSLCLHLCAKYPNSKITAISNSHSQREYIMTTAKERGLNYQNITVLTCNVADDKDGVLDVVKDNDRVLTIEMFEHMKNYNDLLEKIHGFLKPNTGKLFVHIFSHKDYVYHFEKGWMSDTFFSGGTMPSDDLLLYFGSQQHFSCEHHWRVNGTHYEKTLNGWLHIMDSNWKNGTLKPILMQAYGQGKEKEWYINWRLFFLACAELFGYKNGQEWIVSNYLFQVQ